MAPPDPFPNSEVKHRCANGSVVRPCESRSSSALYSKVKAPNVNSLGAFLLAALLFLVTYAANFI